MILRCRSGTQNLLANSGIENLVSGRMESRASWMQSSTLAYVLTMLLKSDGGLKMVDTNLV